jgi:S1-C subfamily serine protease
MGWWISVAVVTWTGVAAALQVEHVTGIADGCVVHLSVRDGRGDEESSGSGFVIASDGRVATNYHVVRGATNVVAVFPDQREAAVTGVWAFDEKVDLAVLQLKSGQYEALELAAEPAREGEDIVLIGSPLGLGKSVSVGIVSAVREQGVYSKQFADEELKSWALQITAAAAPGSSGSPILRGNGEVVGVLAGHLDGLSGAHFGIAVEKLRRLAASAPARPRPLQAATGVRSLRNNLLISGGLFAFVAAVWVTVAQLQNRRSRRAH